MPVENVVHVPDVPQEIRLGRTVHVPLEEFAYVTEEELPLVLDPESLNGGNLVDIYQEREEDFDELSRLEVSYTCPRNGYLVREMLFVTELKARQKPRVLISLSALRAMRQAIAVLTRKVDNLIATLKSCRQHYFKEICNLKCPQGTQDHDVQWFTPHMYEDNFTKVEVTKQLDAGIAWLQSIVMEKDREISALVDKLALAETQHREVQTGDDVSILKKCMEEMPLAQVIFVLKQSVENNQEREASLYSNLDRLLGVRTEAARGQKKSGDTFESDKFLFNRKPQTPKTQQPTFESEDADALQYYKQLAKDLAQQLQEQSVVDPVPPKPSRPSTGGMSGRTAQRRQLKSAGSSREQDWKKALATLQTDNAQLKAENDLHAPKLADLQALLRETEDEVKRLGAQLELSNSQLQHLSQKQFQRMNSNTASKLPKVKSGKVVLIRQESPRGSVHSADLDGERKPSKPKSAAKANRLQRGKTHGLFNDAILDEATLGGVVSEETKKLARDRWQAAGNRVRCENAVLKLMHGEDGMETPDGQACFRWTGSGVEWAESTKAFVLQPQATSALTELQHMMVRIAGLSVVRGLAAGYFEKVGEGTEPRWATSEQYATSKEYGTDLHEVAFTWTPGGMDWAQTSSSILQLHPQVGSIVSEVQHDAICALGGAPPKTLVDYTWTSQGLEWAEESRAFETLPEQGRLVTKLQVQKIRSLGGIPPGCLHASGAHDHHGFGWAQAGTRWARSCGRFQTLPKIGSPVTKQQMQILHGLGEPPQDAFVSVDKGTTKLQMWTEPGVAWAKGSKSFIVLPKAGIPATRLHLDLIRSLGGCPPCCFLNATDSADGADGDKTNTYSWTDQGVTWASSTRSFLIAPRCGSSVSQEELDIIQKLGGAPKGCICLVAAEPSHTKQSRFASEAGKLDVKPDVESVASQTVIGFDSALPTWSCSADPDESDHEGVRNGVMLQGVEAQGCNVDPGQDDMDDVEACVCGNVGSFVRWPKALPGDFVVDTRIKIIEVGHSALTFVFRRGSETDAVAFRVNGQSVCLEGSHWGYVDSGIVAPLTANTWITLRFERAGGKLALSIDGKPVLHGVQMHWGVDGLEWRPHQNIICIDNLRAWPMHRLLSDQDTDYLMLQRTQMEVLQWCTAYVNSQQGQHTHPSDNSSNHGERSSHKRYSSGGGDRQRYISGSQQREQLARAHVRAHTHHADNQRPSTPVSPLSRKRTQNITTTTFDTLSVDAADSDYIPGKTSPANIGDEGTSHISPTTPLSTGQGTWRISTAQGGISSRNAATILNTLAQRHPSPPNDDEEVILHPEVSYAIHK